MVQKISMGFSGGLILIQGIFLASASSLRDFLGVY